MGFTDVPGKMGPADTVLGWVSNGVPQLSDRSMTLRDLNGVPCDGELAGLNGTQALFVWPPVPRSQAVSLASGVCRGVKRPEGFMWNAPRISQRQRKEGGLGCGAAGMYSFPGLHPSSLRTSPLWPAPEADRSQDYELLEGHIEGGRTSITFTRLLDTGDFADRVITPGNMSVVWCGCPAHWLAVGDGAFCSGDLQHQGLQFVVHHNCLRFLHFLDCIDTSV